jgi:hypothetical protein
VIWPFRPHPPLPLLQKVECERRFAAVARLLGRGRVPAASVLTPADIDVVVADCALEELPDRLFAFIANRFELTSSSVEVGWNDPDDLTVDGRSLHYRMEFDDAGQVTAIRLHPEANDLPYRLAGVTAVAVAEYFVQVNSLAETVPRGAFEILPVFFGFGPIMANAALREAVEQHSAVTDMPWERSRVGTVSAIDFGYSMALFDWMFDADHNDVVSVLRPDSKESLGKGLRYLQKTVDCSFEKDFLERSSGDSVDILAEQLRHSSSSMQLRVLMDMYAADEIDVDLVGAVAELLHHREVEIQRYAALILGRCHSLPRAIHDELVIMAEDGPVVLRRAAISALRPGFENDSDLLELVTGVLRRCDPTTAASCINMLLKYDSHPEHLTDSLLKSLGSMVSSGGGGLELGVELLRRIHGAPAAALQEHFRDDPTALAILNEQMNAAEENAER